MADNSKKGKKTRRKKAVALRYDQEQESAPRVVGKGRGAIAEKFLEIAREHGIPVQEDSDLVEVLSKLELDEEIPPSTYVVVAEILAFIYKANDKFPESGKGGES